MKMRSKKWQIKPRIFIMLLLLIIVVLGCVFFAFNLFIQNYIKSTVETQLTGVIHNLTMRDRRPNELSPDGLNFFELPDISMQPKNKIGARGELFIIDSDYVIVNYNTGEEFDDLTQIASYLKSKQTSLDSIEYSLVKTSQSEYYISSMRDPNRPNHFFIFYINVSPINGLVHTVNLALAIIVAIAMVICFLISNIIANSISRPIKRLADFAVEIGKGNFAQKHFAFQDVEFNELAEAMNQSAEKLDKYDNEQRTFFQNVSHELRTPLMSIRCYAEGIECDLMDAKKASETILSETDRLSELVEDLLYISRVDNITTHIEKQENDLRDTLAVCAENLRPIAQKNGIEFLYQFDPNPVLFTYNEKHLYRAFINLISNALRYAKKTVTLSCHQDKNQIVLCVIDDGEGILKEDIPHVFERFYKGRNGKHGIGLSIVKSAIDLHNGNVSVSCNENTCFSVTFSIQ